jgi:hypothetical protein
MTTNSFVLIQQLRQRSNGFFSRAEPSIRRRDWYRIALGERCGQPISANWSVIGCS